MKPQIILTIAILAMTILAGCDSDKVQRVKTANETKLIEIDTLDIHGTKHEVVFWYWNYKGGMMHSPECWCKTDSIQWK